MSVAGDVQTLRDARKWLDVVADRQSRPITDQTKIRYAAALVGELQRLQDTAEYFERESGSYRARLQGAEARLQAAEHALRVIGGGFLSRGHAARIARSALAAAAAPSLDIAPVTQGSCPKPTESNLPPRIVVGANGAYWRDFGEFYSMCPVSSDNDPVVVFAVYERAAAPSGPEEVNEPGLVMQPANAAASESAVATGSGGPGSLTSPGGAPSGETATQ
jgi:hypothetical protein